LRRVSKYYEVVLFSEQDFGAAVEIMSVIDPDHTCHWLGNTAAEYKGKTIGRIKNNDK